MTIAREGSLIGAAKALNLTQPTLSRQMKELEDELGQKLLIRSAQGMLLTSEGLILRKRAEEIMELVEKTKTEFHSAQKDISGEIYIGGGETRGMRLIAQTIRDIQKDYPAIRCHLYSGNAENVTERLDKGLLDFGILIQPTDITKYNSVSLPTKDVWGVIMPKNACSLAKKISRNDLTGLPLICSQQAIGQTSAYNEFREWFGKDFEKLNIVATYNLLFNAALLVEQGVGYILSLDGLINNMNSDLCFRPLSPALESGLNIVWKNIRSFPRPPKSFKKNTTGICLVICPKRFGKLPFNRRFPCRRLLSVCSIITNKKD